MSKQTYQSNRSSQQTAEQKQERRDYHVPGPGSINVTRLNAQGKRETRMFRPGQVLRLTDAEAAELGDRVAPGKAPPAKPGYSGRQDGKYKVVGPGSIAVTVRKTIRGMELPKTHLAQAGEIVSLTAEDARKFGPLVEAVA
jgi:hypothetical protein